MSTSLGWEGNRRSGVALQCVTDNSGLSTYGLNGIWKGDEHPAYAPCSMALLYLCLYLLHTNPVENGWEHFRAVLSRRSQIPGWSSAKHPSFTHWSSVLQTDRRKDDLAYKNLCWWNIMQEPFGMNFRQRLENVSLTTCWKADRYSPERHPQVSEKDNVTFIRQSISGNVWARAQVGLDEKVLA